MKESLSVPLPIQKTITYFNFPSCFLKVVGIIVGKLRKWKPVHHRQRGFTKHPAR